VARIARAMERVCVEARRSRVREISGIDPARGTAIAAGRGAPRLGSHRRKRRWVPGSRRGDPGSRRGGRPPACIYESDPMSFVS